MSTLKPHPVGQWALIHGWWHIMKTHEVPEQCLCGLVATMNVSMLKFDRVLVRPIEPVCPDCLQSIPEIVR